MYIREYSGMDIAYFCYRSTVLKTERALLKVLMVLEDFYHFMHCNKRCFTFKVPLAGIIMKIIIMLQKPY